MKTIKAKVVCTSITNYTGQQKATFMAVTSTSEENKTYSEYTPSLNLDITITKSDAMNAFEPGKEYYIDFTPAN